MLEVGSSDFLILRHTAYDFKAASSAGKAVLSYPHLPRFLDGLADAVEMLGGGVFERADVGYRLTAKGEQAVVKVEDLYSGASLAFQPLVFIAEAEGDDVTDPVGEPGVRVFVNSWDHFSDCTVDEFAAFVRFYERFDLFETSRDATTLALLQQGGIPTAARPASSAPQPARRPTSLRKD